METERLILRPWRDDDAAALYRYACHPEVGPAAGWPPHESEAQSLDIIRTVFSAPETYAVVLRETGEPVGCCGVVPCGEAHSAEITGRSAEIGYWIGVPYWGRGLIPEAVGVWRRAVSMFWACRPCGYATTTATTSRGAWPRSAASRTTTPNTAKSPRSAMSEPSTS